MADTPQHIAATLQTTTRQIIEAGTLVFGAGDIRACLPVLREMDKAAAAGILLGAWIGHVEKLCRLTGTDPLEEIQQLALQHAQRELLAEGLES